jgi:hypothetical protein
VEIPVPGVLSLGVKWQACEADHSPPSSAKDKTEWSCTSAPPVFLHGVYGDTSASFFAFVVMMTGVFPYTTPWHFVCPLEFSVLI